MTLPTAARLVESLVKPQPVGDVLSEEQVNAWRQNLHRLVQLGAPAVPAIREFLAQHIDFDYGRNGLEALGYSSARVAMFDALAQIGGADAINALVEALQSSANPQEIGLLAKQLENLEPGTHQGEALAAARQALMAATEGKAPDRDMAPLFELLQKFGDANVVADLESSVGKWSFYATLALAQLPDGAGIPALLQIAADQNSANSSARTAALEMLAQVATQSKDARAALLNQTRQGELSAADLAAITPMLAGEQVLLQNSIWNNVLAGLNPGDIRKSFIPASNQSLFTAPLGASTPEQINERKALIDELLSATTDPASIQALQRAMSMLLRRSPQMADASGG